MIGWWIALVMAGSSGDAVCADVWFDLRGMPVNSSEFSLRARRSGLVDKVLEAAGAPSPVILYSVASTVFTARFVGAGAMARCEAAIGAVVPSLAKVGRGLRPRFGPKASGCGVCAGDR